MISSVCLFARAYTPEESYELACTLHSEATTFFSNYDWIASVVIPECSKEESAERALLAVKTALNIAKLIVGENHSDRLCTAYCKNVSKKHAKIYLDDSGFFNFSFEITSVQNSIGKNWESIFEKQAGYIFNICKSTITRIIKPTQMKDLKNRFIDALTWYGEAVSDVFLPSKLLKYITAIERMTVTNDVHVKFQVANRAGALCYILKGGSFEEWKKNIGKLYDKRSSIVHGRHSPLDRELSKHVIEAERIANATLLQGLNHFEYLGSEAVITNKFLDAEYNKLIIQVQSHERIERARHYYEMRNKYYPKKPSTVFILESPPASGNYFYDENGKLFEPLFSAMMKLLHFNPKNKADGLKRFADSGCLIVDATYEPVSDLSARKRNDIILNDYNILIADLFNLENTNTFNIVLVKANIFRLLESRLKADGFNVLNSEVIPFPSHGHQKKRYLSVHMEISLYLHKRESYLMNKCILISESVYSYV